MTEAGVIKPLVVLLWTDVKELLAEVAGALLHLALDHDDNRAAIAAAGAVEPLVKVRNSCTVVAVVHRLR